MHAVSVQLLQQRQSTLKFIVNDAGIVFFPATVQHRDVKLEGLSYEDDYRGNALAGVITPDRVEIRFHRDFSDEHVKRIWLRVRSLPEVAQAGLGKMYYQGREVT